MAWYSNHACMIADACAVRVDLSANFPQLAHAHEMAVHRDSNDDEDELLLARIGYEQVQHSPINYIESTDDESNCIDTLRSIPPCRTLSRFSEFWARSQQPLEVR